MKYIGGEIEIDNALLKVPSQMECNDMQDLVLYSSGRGALLHLLEALQLSKPVLLPSYLCESILQPFIELGLKYEFYRIKTDLSVDQSQLIQLLSTSNYSAVYFINYFGFLVNNDFFSGIKQAFNEVSLIEDCTHTTHIPYSLSCFDFTGHFIYGSLRKVLPVSDGAFIIKNEKLRLSSPNETDSGFSKFKYFGKRLRSTNLQAFNSEIEAIYLEMLSQAELIINSSIPRTTISRESKNILVGLNYLELYEKRRKNYNLLYNFFVESETISEFGSPLRAIDEVEMPYMMPFVFKVPIRDLVRSTLREKGVFCAVIWATPEVIPLDTSDESKLLSDSILCFPIDQRYSEEDMFTIRNVLEEVLINFMKFDG